MGQNFKILSCRPCRERKVRCDRSSPCRSCVRHNCVDQCQTYQKPQVSATNKLPLPRQDRRSPRDELRLVGYPNTSQTNPSLVCTADARNEDDYCTSVNPSPHLQPVTHAQIRWPDHSLSSPEALHMHRILEELKTGRHIITAPSVSSLFGAGSRLAPNERIEWQIYLVGSLPLRSQCDLYVSWFLEHINYLYQTIHSSSFRQQYSSFWTTPVASADLVWLSLLYVMISLSTMFIEPETFNAIDVAELRESAPYWFKLSRLALHAGEYEARPCLTQLMVFQESQLYWYATKAIETLNSCLGQAIRCAQALGLDKDRAPSSDLESELRHRIWWDLCSNDTFQSLCLDRQPLVQSHLSEVPFPQNCDDCDLTATSILVRPIEQPTVMSQHVFRAKVFKVLNRLYANNGSDITDYDAVSAVDQEVTTIVNQYPWYLLRQADSGSSPFISTSLPPSFDYLQWQQHVVHTSICIQRIRMYRPFLRTHFESCWSKCVAATEDAFAVYHDIRSSDPERFRRSSKKIVQSYQIFCAAISIAVFLVVERPILPSKILSDIELVMHDLKELAEDKNSIPIAIHGRRSLIKILDAYQGYSRDARNRVNMGEAPTDGVETLHSLVPEIYTVMGGPSSTKKYLESSSVPRSRNTEKAAARNQNPSSSLLTPSASTAAASLQSPLESMSSVAFNNSNDAFGTDPMTGLNLGLHFDVLGWDLDDSSFLDTGLS
ncbi:uncharacterized protein A1O9_12209 [Exophiala aquamarina CBS 119918]|uniref:Zn(2)-C6 fungal-type domain-containing protein n=1 Tax=Exophiala aquamarina CBS 119918 TaxID=1182545 RepID=A0A072NW94_9EURO|nr:uncharacterized protein A1O9_12209 [Exophiala aquamarina CBS 119918]KEF51871.1 hypothetical protein A1O9_12209 [Exophiala aquamarina CBS 119918]